MESEESEDKLFCEDATPITNLEESPGSSRRNSRVARDTSRSASRGSERSKRGSSRRGKKRPSSECLENLVSLLV